MGGEAGVRSVKPGEGEKGSQALSISGQKGTQNRLVGIKRRPSQVNCAPPGNISVHVVDWRTSQGGWLRLALTDVAGSGDITRVQLSASPSPGQVGRGKRLQKAHSRSTRPSPSSCQALI